MLGHLLQELLEHRQIHQGLQHRQLMLANPLLSGLKGEIQASGFLHIISQLHHFTKRLGFLHNSKITPQLCTRSQVKYLLNLQREFQLSS
jgi:hypothetical protein